MALLTTLFVGAVTCSASERLVPEYLRCEYQVDPLGIDEISPRLSWRVSSTVRDEKQTAWRILVSSSKERLEINTGDLWDSGIVVDSDTTGVPYKGKPLASREVCYWKVQVWDRDHKLCAWSQPATWSMGLLHKEDWRAQWIGFDKMRTDTAIPAQFDKAKWIWFSGDKFPNIPRGSRFFMSSLEIPAKGEISKAELLVAANDRLAFHINGREVRIPNYSSGDAAHLVDVTDQIKLGTNLVRVEVDVDATGPAGLIAKLVVVSEGKFTNALVTDANWRSTNQRRAGDNWRTRPIAITNWAAAQVIGPAGSLPWGELKYSRIPLYPPSYLRTSFQVNKPILRATLYATALGLADLHLNGHRVSDEWFTPGWTDYSKRVHYRTFDVTKLLQRGTNALGAILADGWFSGFVGYGGERNHYGTKPRFLGQLQIDYDDGTADVIGTGPGWKASEGAIREADFLVGEKYDARLENHWDRPDFNDRKWAAVDVGAELNPLLQSHPGPPVQFFATIEPKTISEPKSGVYVFDMGQNFAGVARLKFRGKRGQVITLRFAERLNPDGTIYTENLRGARATDTYICAGDKVETWEPRFTFHGFQYVEVTGLEGKVSLDDITGLALSSATPDVGKFVCSDPMLNRLERNIYWTQRANFIDVPTDCPQRDERMGWMGDAELFLRSATLHEDVQGFFTKWLDDVQDDQRADGQYPQVAPLKVAGDDGGPAWADAGVICPWEIYQVYGDTNILERHYDSMARFIEFCRKRSTPDYLPPKNFHCFGDWLNIHDDTPTDVIYTAYFAHSAKLMSNIAEVLGKTADAEKYNELFRNVRGSFNRAFVAADGRIKGDSQTAYALALAFDLLDSDKAELALGHLVRNIKKHQDHLTTGIVGTRSLMQVLGQMGRNDIAEQLVHNDTFPSWGFSIKQGATSIWERWDGWTPEKGFQDPGMNSFDHYAFGSVYQWMIENLGGIRNSSAGYKDIFIAPSFDSRLTSLETTYNSIRGPIETRWERERKGNRVRFRVTIPANTSATVSLPAADPRDIFEGGRRAIHAQGVSFAGVEGDNAIFRIGSGAYDFLLSIPGQKE